MSTVTEIYTKALLDELLLRQLHQNVVPSVASLIDEFTALINKFPLLTDQPYMLSLPERFSRFESMSAEKYNRIWRRIFRDYSILFQAAVGTLTHVADVEQRWNMFYERIKPIMDTLEDRLDELLLSKEDTLGFFSYVKDEFSTTEFVNLNTSTIDIDTNKQIAILPTITGVDTSSYSHVDLDESKVLVKHVASHPSMISSALPQGVTGRDIVRDNNAPYYSVIRTSSSSPEVRMDLTVDLGTKYNFSMISVTPFHSSIRTTIMMTAFYSTNGVDWIRAGDMPTQSIGTSGTWTFPSVEAQYVRFLIIKPSHDAVLGDSFVWNLGIDSLQLFNKSFTEDGLLGSGDLYSNQFRILSSGGNPKGFNKVALEACEILPPGTNISYGVSSDGINFLPIGNSDRKSSHPSIVDFGNEVKVDSRTSAVGFVDGLAAKKLSNLLGGAIALDAIFTSNADSLINIVVPYDDFSKIDSSSLKVWRNVGQKDTTETVRNSPRGWVYDIGVSSTAKTTILITSPKEIDFGHNPIKIDGSYKTGSVTLSEGIHSIETNISNIFVLPSGLENDEAIEEKDPLFPFNHKYLIEGYKYPEDTSGTYSGVALFAESLLTYKPVYSYNVIDDSNLSVFSYAESGDCLIFVVKVDATYADNLNETFEISYRLRDQSFTSLWFKASLWTDRPSSSPILKNYLLKVG